VKEQIVCEQSSAHQTGFYSGTQDRKNQKKLAERDPFAPWEAIEAKLRKIWKPQKARKLKLAA
jgi:hypothetical protein